MESALVCRYIGFRLKKKMKSEGFVGGSHCFHGHPMGKERRKRKFKTKNVGLSLVSF